MRILIRKRAFSLSVITILALGIGLNTTLFNLANGILFKKLPLRDVERLVVLNWYAERVPENLVLTGSSNPHEPGTGRVLNNVFSSAIEFDNPVIILAWREKFAGRMASLFARGQQNVNRNSHFRQDVV